MNTANKSVNCCIRCGEKPEDKLSNLCDNCWTDELFKNYSKMFSKKVQQKQEVAVEDSHFDWWGADSL